MKNHDGEKRLNIIISDDIHYKLKIEVAKERTTINKYVSEAIREKLERTKEE